jgi:hypothetical protein
LHVFMLDLLPVHGKNKNLKFKVHLHNIKMWDIFFSSFLSALHFSLFLMCWKILLADIFQGQQSQQPSSVYFNNILFFVKLWRNERKCDEIE